MGLKLVAESYVRNYFDERENPHVTTIWKLTVSVTKLPGASRTVEFPSLTTLVKHLATSVATYEQVYKLEREKNEIADLKGMKS